MDDLIMYCQQALSVTDRLTALKNGLVVARSGSEEMMDNHLLTDMKLFSERKETFLNKMLVLTVQFYKYARATEM